MNNIKEVMFWYWKDSWYNNIPVSLRVELEKYQFEDSLDCFGSGRVISKNDREGQQSQNFQEAQTQQFLIQHKRLGHLMIWCLKGGLENNKLAPLDI